ncbi:MAG: glycine oxidase ThiO [Myxococcota bacterium]
MNVLVIGGGVMGQSIALRLAKEGASVTVLERSTPGAEASSAAAGMLAPQLEAHTPGPFLDLCLQSRALYEAFVDEVKELSGLDVGYLRCGVLKVAFTEADAQRLHAVVGWQKSIGLRAELIDGTDARTFEPTLSPHVLCAAHFPDDHQVDNRLLLRALWVAATRAGASFRYGNVRALVVEGERAVGVDLDGEVLPADAVVLTAGAWSGLVLGARLDPRVVRPSRGQMVQLQPRPPWPGRIVCGPQGYLVPRADGRLLAGSTVELVGYQKHVTVEGLSRILANALELCPSLSSAPVQEVWAGLRPDTEDHLPILGEGPVRQLFLSTGHYRNGILLAPVSAQLVSELLLGRPPSVDLRPFRHDRFTA